MKRIFATTLAAAVLIAAASIAQMIKPGGGSGGGGGTDTNGLVLLQTCTASSSASCDFTSSISASYDEYQVELLNIVPATDNVTFGMRMSTDGGSSYTAGTSYSWAAWRFIAGGTGNGGANGTSEILLTGGEVMDSTTNWGLSGSLKLYQPASASLHKAVHAKSFYFANGPLKLGVETYGVFESATAVNAFQFLMSSGNIASGTIRVYGIAK